MRSLFILFICGFCLDFLREIIAKPEDYEEITVLANSSVSLPCKAASEGKGAVAVIVLWYRSNSPEPFYSYDLRQHGAGRHWSDDSVFGRRAQFESRRHPLTLIVDPVRSKDEGIYRCRVDFERGPSKTFSIRLNVVTLPSTPVVTDESGNVVEGTSGPYREGGRVVLTCKTIGGRPPPTLVWLRDGKIVEDSFNGDPRGQVRNLLHLENLSRDFLDVTFTCRASNTNITSPLDTLVTINITLAPLTISLKRLDGSQDFVQDGRVEKFECITAGSRPDPKITWWRDGTIFVNAESEETRNPNITRSVLRLTPKPSDLGVIITCRVENPVLPGSVLEESFKLNVHYLPRVTLDMGLGLNPQAVREGSDVFMECNVTANPRAFKIVWMHEGNEIFHNVTAGIIISNQTLVLQKVQKERTGAYRCQAVNFQGRGTSKPIPLTVMYAPLCKTGLETVYQVTRHATANITCLVDAQPKNVTFRWQFNSSGGLLDIKEDTINTRGTSSVIYYTPDIVTDYGVLICNAENIMGTQDSPCIFNITAAKPPELLESCAIRNQSSHSVFVTCKDFPTELPTSFTMEVHASDDLALVTTVRNNTPAFVASGLTPGTAYILHVIVKTPMGVSDPIKLRAFTVKTAEKRMGITEHEADVYSSNFTPVVIGIVTATLLTFLFLLIVVIKICPRRRTEYEASNSSKCPSTADNDGSVNMSPKETMSSTYSRHSPISEEKNPDLIPLNNECDYQLEELRVPVCHQTEHGHSPVSCQLGSVPSSHRQHFSSGCQPMPQQMHSAPCYNLVRPHMHQSYPYQQHYQHPSTAQLNSSCAGVSSLNNSFPTDECAGLTAFYGGNSSALSNIPPFPPPEAFRGSGTETPQKEFQDSPTNCEPQNINRNALHQESSV